MKPEQYEEAAQRIIDDDGAAGVALLMADHTRCLEQLRAIYDEAAPRQVADRGAEAVIATVRDLALNALKMPEDLRQRLVASGRPALTEGERIEFEDEERIGELQARVDALEEAGADLLRHLGIGEAANGSPPWWMLAAAAANELHRLAVEKDGV